MTYLNELLSKLMIWAEEERGQTLVEYGLIVALISVVAIAGLTLIGQSVQSVFNSVGNTLAGAV